MRAAIIAIVIGLATVTTTPAEARRHGHHHVVERSHHSAHKGRHDTITQTETPRPGRTPAPGQSSPPVRFEADLAPDSQPDLWRMGEAPKPVWGHRPKKMVGRVLVNGEEFPVVTGGSGWSIPYGHWLVTPDEVGPWGSRHNAIGLNNGDDIPDPEIHRGREGVEIHAANHNATAGCVGVKRGFDALRSRVLAMVEEFGKVWLHVLPNGMAITATPTWEPRAQTIYAAADDEDGQTHERKPHHTNRAQRNERQHYAERHRRRVHYASSR